MILEAEIPKSIGQEVWMGNGHVEMHSWNEISPRQGQSGRERGVAKMAMQLPVSENCKNVKDLFSGVREDWFNCYGSQWIYS